MDSFGAFSHCMVDGDPEALRRDRKARRLGLAVSLALQFALLAAVVLVPFLAPSAVPQLMSMMQIPIWRPPTIVRAVQTPKSERAAPTMPYAANSASRPSVNNRQSTADFRGVAAEFEPSLEGEVGDPLGSLASGGTPTPPAPSVQSEAAHRPVSVSSSVMEALLINRVEPAYPAIARTTRTSGAVVLSAVIAADGTIQSLRVVSGSPLLTVAATAAVREWRFKPTLLDGQPIEVQTLITINFVLD